MSDTNGIEETAAVWAARLTGGVLATDDQRALDAWLAADRRHLGAFVKAQAIWARFDVLRDSLPGPVMPAAAPRASAGMPSRRGLIRAAGLAMAASVIGTVGVSLWADRPVSYATPRGELRRIVLGDGSVIVLDAASQIRVALHRHARAVELVAGRALFDVAKDAARPFTVTAGHVSIRALGTSFTVDRFSAGAVDVVMRAGVVQVSDTARPGVRARLAAAEAMTVTLSGAVSRRMDAGAVDRALDWRTGMLDFNGTSLERAATTFARYGGDRIELAPNVRGLRISGRFAANNPRGFATAAAASLGLTATPIVGGVRLSQ